MALRHTCNDSVVLAAQEDLQETAGIIDQENKLVLISSQFSLQMQNFTAAHELGYAIFYKQTVMHRDLPIEGVGQV